MKIITWNCNMAFRNKYESILQYKPDILVIQECEHLEKLHFALEKFNPKSAIWHGNNKHKGLGIFSFNDYHLTQAESFDENFEYVFPLIVTKQQKSIHLFAIWAMPHRTNSKGYIGQVWRAINFYSESLNDRTILIGDFNSNAIWDDKRKIGNHTHVVNYLYSKDIISIYHDKMHCTHGKEKDPTLYLLKKIHKPYHIDYCFSSKSLIQSETTIEIGLYKDWISLSDHMPLIVNNISM